MDASMKGKRYLVIQDRTREYPEPIAFEKWSGLPVRIIEGFRVSITGPSASVYYQSCDVVEWSLKCCVFHDASTNICSEEGVDSPGV
jgi:hypothetical protein